MTRSNLQNVQGGLGAEGLIVGSSIALAAILCLLVFVNMAGTWTIFNAYLSPLLIPLVSILVLYPLSILLNSASPFVVPILIVTIYGESLYLLMKRELTRKTAWALAGTTIICGILGYGLYEAIRVNPDSIPYILTENRFAYFEQLEQPFWKFLYSCTGNHVTHDYHCVRIDYR